MPGVSPSDGENKHSHISGIGEIIGRKSSVSRLVSKTMNELKKAYNLQSDKAPADLIFDLFRPTDDAVTASIHTMIKVLRSFGILENDPRLRLALERNAILEAEHDDDDNYCLSRDEFKFCIEESVELIARALRNQLTIPNWVSFTDKIRQLFIECRSEDEGTVASYIPQLARQNPKLWGMAICTVDGQRCNFGDSKVPFCFQSVSKAFNYAIVSTDLGSDVVHKFIGHEPSGRLFNEICLDSSGRPHNPMINAGAIITTSLIRNNLPMADRFDFILNKFRQIAGGEHVGFNNATFLSERESADRNYAISYFMKEYKCFPSGGEGLREELDLYFQLCSLETTCETLSVMAATLANGGVCPMTGERCIAPSACRDVLSLMYSCGMYDLSGKFAFQVGLPAKSGVSGAMMVVIPNVMGICLFAPPLDKTGNSTKGVTFCRKLVQTFNFHNYDSLGHVDAKIDPRRRISDKVTEAIVNLLFATKNGDMEVIKRYYIQGMDFEMSDYDGRTALHIAAAEGHYNVCKFLLYTIKVDWKPKDRWGRTPLDEAKAFSRHSCKKLLNKFLERERNNIPNEGVIDTENSDSESDQDISDMTGCPTIGVLANESLPSPEIETAQNEDISPEIARPDCLPSCTLNDGKHHSSPPPKKMSEILEEDESETLLTIAF